MGFTCSLGETLNQTENEIVTEINLRRVPEYDSLIWLFLSDVRSSASSLVSL